MEEVLFLDERSRKERRGIEQRSGFDLALYPALELT
jgi:hypothetical protein